MTVRFATIAFLVTTLSTAAIAAGVGGAGRSSGGAAGGIPGSLQSGTAGVSGSTTNPSIGTPGVPGPSSGAGVPGGPGPGNTAVVPNLPPPPSSVPSAGSGRPAAGGTTVNSTDQGHSNGAQSNAQGAKVQTAGSANFNPGAVTDQSLAIAIRDITAMSSSELRALVTMFDLCTVNGHPADRQDKCGSASKQYKLSFGKDRAVDQAIAELERVVRFQRMFRTTGAFSTEYEDSINKRLRVNAAVALGSTVESQPVSLRKSP